MRQAILVFMLSLEEKLLFYYFFSPVPVFYFFKKLFKDSCPSLPIRTHSLIFSHIRILVHLSGRSLQLQSPRHQSVAEQHSAASSPCDLMLANYKHFLQQKLKNKTLELILDSLRLSGFYFNTYIINLTYIVYNTIGVVFRFFGQNKYESQPLNYSSITVEGGKTPHIVLMMLSAVVEL